MRLFDPQNATEKHENEFFNNFNEKLNLYHMFLFGFWNYASLSQGIKVQFFVHCTIFWAIITFWEFLVFSESHRRAEYYNGKYFRKKKIKVEENEDENFKSFI